MANNLMARVESEKLKSKTLRFLKQSIDKIDKVIMDEQNAIGSDKDLISKLKETKEKMSKTIKKSETLYAQVKKKDKTLLYHSSDINDYSLQNLIDLAKIAAKGNVKELDDITKNYENLDLTLDEIDGPGFLQQVSNGTVFGNVKFSSLLLGIGVASMGLGLLAPGATGFAAAAPLLNLLGSGIGLLATASPLGFAVAATALVAKFGPKLIGTWNKLFNTKSNLQSLGSDLNNSVGESSISVTGPNRTVIIYGDSYDMANETDRESLASSLESNGAASVSHDENRFSFNNTTYNTHLPKDLAKLESAAEPILQGTRIRVAGVVYKLNDFGDRDRLATELKNHGAKNIMHDDYAFCFDGKKYSFYTPSERDDLENAAEGLIRAKEVVVNNITYNLSSTGKFKLETLLNDLGAKNVWTSPDSFSFNNKQYKIEDDAERAQLGIDATAFVKANEKRIITIKTAGDFDFRKPEDVNRFRSVVNAAGATSFSFVDPTVQLDGATFDVSTDAGRTALQTAADGLVKEMNITVAGKAYNLGNDVSLGKLKTTLELAGASVDYTPGIPQFGINGQPYDIKHPIKDADRLALQDAAEKIVGEKTITVDGIRYNLAEDAGKEDLKNYLNQDTPVKFIDDASKQAKWGGKYFAVNGKTYDVEDKIGRLDLQADAEALIRTKVSMKISVDGKTYDLEDAVARADLAAALCTLSGETDKSVASGDTISIKSTSATASYNVNKSTDRANLEKEAQAIAKECNKIIFVEGQDYDLSDKNRRKDLVDYMVNNIFDKDASKVSQTDKDFTIEGSRYETETSGGRAALESKAKALANEKDKVIVIEGISYDLSVDTARVSLKNTIDKLIEPNKATLTDTTFTFDAGGSTHTFDTKNLSGRTGLKGKVEELAREKDKTVTIEGNTYDLSVESPNGRKDLVDFLNSVTPNSAKLAGESIEFGSDSYDSKTFTGRANIISKAKQIVNEKDKIVTIEGKPYDLSVESPNGRKDLVDFLNSVTPNSAKLAGESIEFGSDSYDTKTLTGRANIVSKAKQIVNEKDKIVTIEGKPYDLSVESPNGRKDLVDKINSIKPGSAELDGDSIKIDGTPYDTKTLAGRAGIVAKVEELTKGPDEKKINVGNSEYNLADEKECKLLLAALLSSKSDSKLKISYASPTFHIGDKSFNKDDKDQRNELQEAAQGIVDERNKDGITIKVGNENYNLANETDKKNLIASLAIVEANLTIDGNNFTISFKNDKGEAKTGTFDVTKLADRTMLQYLANTALKREKLFSPTEAQQNQYDEFNKPDREGGAVTLVDIQKAIVEAGSRKGYVFTAGKFKDMTIEQVKELKESYLTVELKNVDAKEDPAAADSLDEGAKTVYNKLTEIKEAGTIRKIIAALIGDPGKEDSGPLALKGANETTTGVYKELTGLLDSIEDPNKKEETRNEILELLIKLERVKEQRKVRNAAGRNNSKEVEDALAAEELGG